MIDQFLDNGGIFRSRRRVTRIWRPLLNPLFKLSNDVVGQPAGGRHFKRFELQSLQQEAFRGLTRHDCRPGFSTLAHALTRIEQQSTLNLS